MPVAGVVPYMDIALEDEDSLTERFDRKDGRADRHRCNPLSENCEFYRL